MLRLIKKLDHRYFLPYLKDEETRQFFVHHADFKFEANEQQLSRLPESLRKYYRKCIDTWTMNEFYFKYTKECIIEPSGGWAVTPDDKIIPQSVWNYFVHGVNKPFWLRYKFYPTKTIKLKNAISLQYGWMNYWHFYSDLLGQLHLADAQGLPYDTPVIVPAGIQKMGYFKQFLELSENLRGRNWIFQDQKTKIVVEEAHFLNTFWDHRKNFDGVLEYLDFDSKWKEQQPGQDKIFLTRKPNRGRNLTNMDAVYEVVQRYGFRLVDCDDLSIPQQMQLFQNAAHVISIHGAGLTNIVYRRGNDMKLLELFSASFFNPCYYWLAQQYDYDYYAMVGSVSSDGTPNGYFSIDLNELERTIKTMLG